MFLFGKGKARNEAAAQQTGLSPSEDLFSSAAATALAAAAYSNQDAKTAAPPNTGRRLRGKDIAIQLDALHPNESVIELKVQTITLVKTELKLEQTQKVSVSDAYICYGLKPGHIRALDRDTGRRALFRGHPTSISHMAMFSPSTNLLASVSRQGDIAVRYLQDAADKPDDEAIDGSMHMAAQLSASALQGAADSPFAPVTLAWHPTVPQILAAGAGSNVNIYEVPTNAPAGGAPPLPSQPGITYSIAGASSDNGEFVTGVAFTPSGDLLVAGDSAGGVHAWWLEGEEATEAPLLSWNVQDTTSATASGKGIGSISILHQAADGSSLVLTGDSSNSTLQLWALPAAAAAVAGNSQAVHLQTISFQGTKKAGAVFCHVAVQTELQLVVLADTARHQVYTLHYSLTGGSSSGSNGTGGAAAAAAFDYAAFFSVQQPILSCTAILEPDAAGEKQLLLCCVQTDAIQQYLLTTAMCVAGPVAEAEVLSMDKASEQASSITASTAEAAGAAAAAEGDGNEHGDAAAAAAGAASLGAEVPPPTQLPTPGLLAARTAAHHKAAAADAAASPPRPAGAAADKPLAAAAAAAGGPAGLKQQPQEVAADSSAADTGVSVKVAPPPPMPTHSLIHSAEKVPSAASGTPAAAAAAAEHKVAAAAKDGAAGLARAPEVVEDTVAADVAPAAAGSVSPAELAALQQQMDKLLHMQERMAAQLQASTQQTVTGVKTELGRSLKSTETNLLKQIEAALKASAKKAEDERRKGAAKERQELEKMMSEQLNQVSASLHRDLSKVVIDTAREQARAAVNATVNAVTPAVASAVAASLQQELTGGSLQSLLEASLSSSLAGPLHEALRNNFDASLIPAFERATRVMFSQVESAFNSWLADSSKAVASAQADAASSLSSTLAQLQAVVAGMRTDLADTSKSLNRLAASTASRATADAVASSSAAAAARAGGAGVGAGAGADTARMSGGGAAAVATQDPRAEIGALLARRDLEAALVTSLNTVSLDVLLWTCKQIDPAQVLSSGSLNLSQTTLLSLVQQLSTHLSSDADTALKLSWLAEAAPAIDPHDPVTEPHLRGVLTAVMNSLKQLVLSLPQTDAMAKKGKITLHLFNSLLHQ